MTRERKYQSDRSRVIGRKLLIADRALQCVVGSLPTTYNAARYDLGSAKH